MDLFKEANELQAELSAWRRQLHTEPSVDLSCAGPCPLWKLPCGTWGLGPSAAAGRA